MTFISLFVFFFALFMTQTVTSTLTSETNSETPSPPDVTNHPNLRLLDPKCGPVTLRVTDGNKTGVFEFPWMAQLMYSNPEVGQTKPYLYLCSGTIISSRYILTAAFCVIQRLSTHRLIRVRVGDHDISKERDCNKDENGQELECAEKYQEFDVESVHYHPEYSPEQHYPNDIALIRLNSSVDFRPLNVKSICLPYGSAANLSQRKVIVSGWGKIPFGPQSQVLLQEKLSLMPHEQCNELYFERNNKTVSYKQLCVGGLNYTNPCVADGGGPLQAPGIYNGRSVRTIQYGVISYGITVCGINGYPGVYSKVAYYMDWILNTMTD